MEKTQNIFPFHALIVIDQISMAVSFGKTFSFFTLCSWKKI